MVDICEVLEYLIKEFEKIDGKNFKINYVKVALPAETSETDREKIWSELWGDDENRRYSEYTQYPLFEREEDTGPARIVYGVLVGTNVTEGWRAINNTIKKTVKQLLLRRYEPESMPDSDTFLDNFSKFADTKVPIQQQGGDVYFWYEFLLKLSQEQGAFIDGELCLSDLCMSELPCATKIQGLKTDVLTASKLALQYLLDKAEQRSRQKEFTGADRNNLSQEKPAEIVQKTKAVKKLQAEKRGRPRIYTDDQLKRMLDSYDEFYEETKDSKAAWNKVAKHHGAKNGDAARVACMNYRKRLKKSK